jgi:Bacterial Ig-like domain (group 2)
MRVFLFRSTAALVVVCSLLAMLSCAHDQQLVSIAIKPDTETFGDANTPVSADAGSSVNLTAFGNYIHPPVQKNITDQVAWASDTPQMVTVDATGKLVATGLACGNALVSATVQTNHSVGNRSSSGAIVTGFMTANVVCFNAGGGSANPVLTVDIVGTGAISSSPPGLGCATSCANSFPSGTPITITAMPTGTATSATWVGCDSSTGGICTINSLTANRIVTVTFS